MRFVRFVTVSLLSIFILTGCGSIPMAKMSSNHPNSHSVSKGKANQVEDKDAVLNPKNPDAAAFKNMGDLAFVRKGLLYTLNGKTGEVKQLTYSGQASNPSWSRDGQWLAYLNVPNPYAGFGSLCLVRRDGSQAHQVKGLPGPAVTFSWSPASDILAAGDQNSRLWLVPADGTARSLAEFGSFAWSSDGRFLAYSSTLPSSNPATRTDALYTVNINGGKPIQEVAPSEGQISVAACWPDDKGLLYWLAPFHGVSVMADGLNLWSLWLGDRTPKLLTSCLVNKDWLSFSPQGKLLLVKGNSRFPWENKELAIADPKAGSVNVLPSPKGDVALDPSWSPDGKYIAFVAAKDMGASWSATPNPFSKWQGTRFLWVENSDGSGAHPLSAAGNGISRPVWSKDGSSILYARDDALWLIKADGRSAQRIIAGSSSTSSSTSSKEGNSPDSIDYAWFQP
ncbi:protein TolB [Peptococcaceae bacterium CEB3]|nr:protein TolB [Peptococcaceae bacterium CEB3]